MTLEDEIKTALANGELIIGTRTVSKALKAGGVKTVVVANNAPDNVRKDLEHYSKLSKTKLENFKGTGKQLGIFLGKPFPVAVLAIRSGAKK